MDEFLKQLAHLRQVQRDLQENDHPVTPQKSGHEDQPPATILHPQTSFPDL